MAVSSETHSPVKNYVAKIKVLLKQVSEGLREIGTGKLEPFPSVLCALNTIRELSDCFDYQGPVEFSQTMIDRMTESICTNPDLVAAEIQTLISACDTLDSHMDQLANGSQLPEKIEFPQRVGLQGDTFGGREKRRHQRFLTEVRTVSILLSPEASVINESFSGIALAFEEDFHFASGQEIDIEYKGAPMRATVSWARANDTGQFCIGAEWK